jgi:hypothetical protein
MVHAVEVEGRTLRQCSGMTPERRTLRSVSQWWGQ